MKKTWIISVIALSISGCSLFGSSTNEQHTLVTNEGTVYGSQMFIDRCDLHGDGTQSLHPIAITFLSGVASEALDFLGVAIKQSLDDKVTKTTVTENIQSMADIGGKCIYIVRGTFNFDEPTDQKGVKPYNFDSESRSALFMRNDNEELFIKLGIKSSSGYISYYPIEVRYSGITPKSKGKIEPRDIGVLIGYAQPDTEILGDTMPQRLIELGTMNATEGSPAKLKYEVDGKLAFSKATQWQALGENAKKPVTLVAQIIETEKANQFSKLLKKAYEENEDKFKQQAMSALNDLDYMKTQQTLAAERITAETGQLELESSHLTKLFDAQVALEALDALCVSDAPKKSSVQKLQNTLYSAQKTANISALTLKRPIEFESLTKTNGICPSV